MNSTYDEKKNAKIISNFDEITIIFYYTIKDLDNIFIKERNYKIVASTKAREHKQY